MEGSKKILSFNYCHHPPIQVHDQGKLPPGTVKVKTLIRTENSKPRVEEEDEVEQPKSDLVTKTDKGKEVWELVAEGVVFVRFSGATTCLPPGQWEIVGARWVGYAMWSSTAVLRAA